MSIKLIEFRFALALVMLGVIGIGVSSSGEKNQIVAEAAESMEIAAQAVVEGGALANKVTVFLPGSFK